MQSTSAWVVISILGAVGVVGWQRSEIVHLRAQVARQDAALGEVQARVADLGAEPPSRENWIRRVDGYSAELRTDERNLILNQYRDVLAKMNLPAATASRLQDLLADRVEAILDAEDAAVREGFAKGSAAMGSAVATAIGDLDREIAALLGPDGARRLNTLSAGGSPELAAMPAPALPPIVVNVVTQTPIASPYGDQSAQPEVADDYAAPYIPYTYYPYASVFVGRAFGRPFGGERSFGGGRPLAGGRPDPVRAERPEFRGDVDRVASRPR